MNTSYSPSENSIGSPTSSNQYISGPHYEPPTISNATTYWRCQSCSRESIYEQDLYRSEFHAPDCEVCQEC